MMLAIDSVRSRMSTVQSRPVWRPHIYSDALTLPEENNDPDPTR
jgi:hypothetical protein